MSEYSEGARQWLDRMRSSVQERIDSFHNLPDGGRELYPTPRDYFVWSREDQEIYGAVGPLEADVDDLWDETPPGVRKELGGSKTEAVKLVANLLRDEFGIDIVEEVLRHSEPCYAVHDEVLALDWDTEEETGYRRVARLVRHKDLDRGSALQLYWGFAPEYYTRFATASSIEKEERRRAFELLKALEARLMGDDLRTNLIPFTPPPEGRGGEDAPWQIPLELTRPNLRGS